MKRIITATVALSVLLSAMICGVSAWVSTPTVPGDVNLDNTVNVSDAIVIIRTLASYDVGVYSFANADVNSDGEMDVKDAILIIQKCADWPVVMPEVPQYSATYADGQYTFDLTAFEDSEKVCENPNKGWYIHYYDNGLTRYGAGLEPEDIVGKLPCLDHIYIRIAWSYLEPAEGEFNWELIDEQIDKWAEYGVRTAFRITCKETSKAQYYATPEWVREAGAEGIELDNAWEPIYDDPIFLEKLANFHAAFAARYDDNPNVIYVDIGSFGDWGEGHTAFGSGTRYTEDMVLDHIDIFYKCYKNTQIVINDDMIYTDGVYDPDEIIDYIVEKGISVRDDSIGVKYHMEQYGKTSLRSTKHFNAVFPQTPVVLELDHYSNTVESDTWLGGETLLLAAQAAHATYAGFHGYPLEWLAENEEAAKTIANRLGYWYFINSVSVSDVVPELTSGDAAETDYECNFTVKLENRGSAPAYDDHKMILTMKGEGGAEYTSTYTVTPEAFPMMKKTGYFHDCTFNIKGIVPDSYDVYLNVIDSNGTEIELAIKDELLTEGLGYKVMEFDYK